ncbi:CDP-glycerol glycerophosphotransferase family protein [Campylobacter lari]|uniref:CDP-glycerol glycerophosphotransferase family protein n=1 Tax=Campylobacter lari TaxID=201 RepID=UPI0012C94B78|nr:CDP-glycerol glycerophosphotransferase family protein [Campylobacter lari]EAK0440353.1 glycosyltransferase [Campylobacter lari]EIY6495295.1 CDP-glycerol glycerophosphotransferase family protein [Campylobacter lari]MCV3534594.1 CDP-glycerol glycerophosphotransferase family protein [Campylobacter lari]MCW0205258.1 CDP-glycerol glycerophosphotransferase family protein [Campylobacter lari]HEG5920302.1 CDP-glycerol glycerophosphotransferase family protein [Campylobacter lari]
MFWICYFLGMWYYQKKKDYKKAQSCFLRALKRREKHAKCNFKLGMSYFKLKQWKEANEFISKALIIDPSKKSWHTQLMQTENHLNSMFFRPQKLWWKEVEDLKKQIQDKEKNFFICRDLAIALENMKRYHEATSYYEQAIKLSDKKESILYYKLGYCYESKGHDSEPNIELAQKYYNKAIKYDENLEAEKFGVGIFHEKQGLWREANKAYLKYYEETKNLDNDDLLYQIAFSFEKLYDWTNAEVYYKKALKINYQRPYTHYRLALVLERQKKFEEAVEFYKEALRRNNAYKSYWYFRLCKCLNSLGRYEESAKFLNESQVIQNKPYGLSEDVLKDKNLKRRVFYTECYENLKIIDNVILYESFHGKSMSCNPYAIFLYLLKQDNFKDYTHVWVVNNINNVKSKFKKMKNVVIIKRGSDLYLKYLASAKYLINNVTFPDYFIRKDGQKYLNTWHGTPIKYLGKKIQTGFMEHANAQRNFLHATHLIHPNLHTKDIMESDYDIKDLFSGVSILTGYPRIDLSLSNDVSIKNDLGIKDNQKVLLYAPTWRGGLNKQYFDFERLKNDILELQKSNFKVLVSVHHEVEHLFDNEQFKNVLLPPYIEMNELLSIVDVLITDYSSVMFDFMVLERPIICYVYDYEYYKQERGLYFDTNEITHHICKTIEDVKEVLNSKDLFVKDNSRLTSLKHKFYDLEDGKSCERVVSIFFDDMEKKDTKNCNNILFYVGPFIPNGIMSSFKNLVHHLQNLDFNIFVSIDPASICSHEERLEQFYLISEKVKILPKVGSLNLTLEEFYIEKESLNKEKSLQNYKREFKRLYADANFKAVINFEGYNVFWVKLFSSVDNNMIFLHNNMQGEFEKRFPYLEQNFKCYKDYKKILSVSKQTNEENEKNLANAYDIEKDKFDFLENTINYNEIITKSKEKLDETTENKYFKTDYKVFINIARLSVEKDQAKLIEAFKVVNEKYSKTLLLILGEGPLKEDLQTLIKKLDLKKKVFLLGRISNPFPYLKKADCFVMSSNHEGQPMTLLEALVLNKAIVATDIPGNVSVLENRGGLIVDNTIKGLVYGMERYLLGKIERKDFDCVVYNNAILYKLDEIFKGLNSE